MLRFEFTHVVSGMGPQQWLYNREQDGDYIYINISIYLYINIYGILAQSIFRQSHMIEKHGFSYGLATRCWGKLRFSF